VQRSMGSVPMVQPRVPSSFAPGNKLGNELSGPAISTVDEPGGDPIEIDARQDMAETFDGHRASPERQNAADADRGEGIAAIERESDQEAGDAARNANGLAESSGGVGGFLMRLLKPKTTGVVQLKQGLNDGSSAIRPTVTTHSPDGGDIAPQQPERRAGLSEATTANPADAMHATHSRSGTSPSLRAVVSGSRQKVSPLSDDAAPELAAIQHPNPEGGLPYFAAHDIAPDTPDIPDIIEQGGPEVGAMHRAQQPPVSDRAVKTTSLRAVSPVVGDPAKQVSIASVQGEKVALTQGPARDETDPQDPPVMPAHPETEPPGLPEADGPKAISPRVMVPAISEPQFVHDDRPTGIESPSRESPTIEVAIGRIEVRAATPPMRPRRARPGPTLLLDEYLNRRRRRQR